MKIPDLFLSAVIAALTAVLIFQQLAIYRQRKRIKRKLDDADMAIDAANKRCQEQKEEQQKRLKTPEQNRKYYLHERLRNVYDYSSSLKTVFVPEGEEVNNAYVDALIAEFGYTITRIAK